MREYLAALEGELALRLGAGGDPQPVDTIYLGGGTPSLLGAAGIADALGVLRGYFRPAPNAEVTIEVNPEDVGERSVQGWRAAGVTRISLGVQSFDPRVLAWMHRVHDAETAQHAAALVAAAGFASWSLDLIFALPEELGRDWRRDLDAALALDPPHVSLYGLTVEPHTPLFKWVARGTASDAPEERYEQEFLEADVRLTNAGLRHYEVSNYARPQRVSRHNSAYWSGAPYVGFGPSAHTFDGNERRWNVREYQAWVRQVRAGNDPQAGNEVLTSEQRSIERLYLGLRSGGISVDVVPPEIVERWCAEGWAVRDESWVRLTAKGWLRLDALVAALTVYSNHC